MLYARFLVLHIFVCLAKASLNFQSRPYGWLNICREVTILVGGFNRLIRKSK